MLFKKPKIEYKFETRAEAFNYMLKYLMDSGVEPLDAAKQANEFAEIFATNMGIPINVEPDLKGVDKLIVNVDKIVTYADKHPKVVDFLVGALTLGVGFFTGKKTSENCQPPKEDIPPQTSEPINFNEID